MSDFIYPGLFAVSYSLLLTWVFSKGYGADSKIFFFAVVPVFGGVFDYLENFGIRQIIKSYPDVSHQLVKWTSIFTILKSGFTTLFLLLLFAGGFQAVQKSRTRRDSLQD